MKKKNKLDFTDKIPLGGERSEKSRKMSRRIKRPAVAAAWHVLDCVDAASPWIGNKGGKQHLGGQARICSKRTPVSLVQFASARKLPLFACNSTALYCTAPLCSVHHSVSACLAPWLARSLAFARLPRAAAAARARAANAFSVLSHELSHASASSNGTLALSASLKILT